jgi:pimeloyl-ACP methyl ester carboxylesterase
VNDINVAYNEYGENNKGIPLLLITGYGCTMDMWPSVMVDMLSAYYRVIVFDNRGMGLTTNSDKEFSIELFVDDTSEFMHAIGITKAHVFGWSMGAFISKELSLRYPEKVAKLVLYAVYCGCKEAIKPDKKIWDTLFDISGTLEERTARMFSLLFPSEWLKDNPNPSKYFPQITEPVRDGSIVRQARAIDKWNGTFSRLHQIIQPSLIITGTEDIVTPPENAFIMAEQIPRASVVQIKGGGHGLMYQYPGKLANIVITFLKN